MLSRLSINLSAEELRRSKENRAGALSGLRKYIRETNERLNEGANVDNCHVDGSIKQYSNGNTHVECAGIVAFNRGTIQNSSNNASISAELNNKTFIQQKYPSG